MWSLSTTNSNLIWSSVAQFLKTVDRESKLMPSVACLGHQKNENAAGVSVRDARATWELSIACKCIPSSRNTILALVHKSFVHSSKHFRTPARKVASISFFITSRLYSQLYRRVLDAGQPMRARMVRTRRCLQDESPGFGDSTFKSILPGVQAFKSTRLPDDASSNAGSR